MDYLSKAWIGLYFLVSPVVYFVKLLLSILLIASAPLIYLGQYLLYACWLPVRLLGHFEVGCYFFCFEIVFFAIFHADFPMVESLRLSWGRNPAWCHRWGRSASLLKPHTAGLVC